MIVSYIFRQILVSLLLFSFVVTGLLWLTQSLRFIEIIVNYNISLKNYFTLVIFLIPDLISLALPICGVLSAVWVYYRLIIQHEFLAMQALGLSTFKLARPIFITGTLITMVCFVLNLFIVPSAFRVFRDYEYQIRGTLSRVFLNPGAFTTIRGLTFYTDQYTENDGYKMVLIDIPGTTPSTFIAERGNFDGRTFFLKQGYRQSHQKKHNTIETLFFEHLTYDISQFMKPTQERLVKPHERNLIELFWPSKNTTRNVIQHFLIEGHQRILMPLLSLIDMLIVVLFFLCKANVRRRFQKRRLYQVLFGVLLTHIGTYISLNICAKHMTFMFLPYAGVLALSFFLLRNIQRQRC